MQNIAVTSGYKYTDIDALSCAIAYSNLLNLKGVKSKPYLANPNQSVSTSILNWSLKFLPIEEIQPDQDVVIVDISDPDFFPKNVDINKVVSIFDHHTGFESFWKSRLGENSKIEFIGSCATLIFEEWEESGNITQLDTTFANLLYTAIISNTLNFKASVTNTRDIKAFDRLKKYINLPDNWAEYYFNEIQELSLVDPKKSLVDDIKQVNVGGKKFVISQLELWESEKFLLKNKSLIKSLFNIVDNNDYWFYTSPSIKQGVNYIYTQDAKTQVLLKNILNVTFVNDIAVTPKLYLRKELIKLIQNI